MLAEMVSTCPKQHLPHMARTFLCSLLYLLVDFAEPRLIPVQDSADVVNDFRLIHLDKSAEWT